MTAWLWRLGIALAFLGVASVLPATVSAQPLVHLTPWASLGSGEGEFAVPAALATDTVGNWFGTANLPPVCSGAVASEAVLWPPNHGYHPVAIQGVTDPDGDPVTITVTGITQDEPEDASGDGDTCPDGMIDADGVAHVRLERSGAGNGRVYRIRFVATDDRGASCEGAVAVCVPHDRRDASACADDGQTVNSLGPCPGGPSPIPIIDECRCAATVVYTRDPGGGLTARPETTYVTDSNDPHQPTPRDTCAATARIDIKWHAEPPVAIGYRYKLDEPQLVEVGPEVTNVTYHSGTPPDTVPPAPGIKVFLLRAVDQAFGFRDTTRRFQLNFSPDTWFAGPDPGVTGAPWVTKPNGEKYALLINGRIPAGGLPGTLLGPDSVRILPVAREPHRTFLEIYSDTVFLRREFDTVHVASWVVFHNGGFDRDSRYKVKVADGIERILPSFPGGAVLTPAGQNGSPVGFRSRINTYLTPNGPLSQMPQSGLYPFFDPNDVLHFPRSGAYHPMFYSGKAYSLQRAEDGDGARDGRVDDARRIVEFPRDDYERSLRPLVLAFYVNYPPELLTTNPAFRPRVAAVDTFFSRYWDLRLPADDPDPYVLGDPVGGPSASKTLRLRFKVTGKDTQGQPFTFFDPPVDAIQPKYVNVSDVALLVPETLASGPATLTVELCDCAFCEVNPGEGRCITRDINVYYMAPPVAPTSIQASKAAAPVLVVSPATPVATSTSLFAPYPDPASREITFRFSLVAEGEADVDLYNVAGQRVRGLASERFSAGEHSRVWNRQDEKGRQVAPGVYFIRLRTGEAALTRKFFVAR